MHQKFFYQLFGFIFLLLGLSEGAFAWKMEADKVTVKNTGGNTSTHINFRQSYNSAPLVFTLPSSAGGEPSTLRVTNISTTGFDIYSVEPDGNDGPHVQMSSIAYIAIEAGSHEFPDGTKIVAASINTQQFQSSSIPGASWQNIALSGFSSTPVVLGQIQSRNNERTDLPVPSAVSQPWLTTAIRNISSTSFDIALERSETTIGAILANEKIAYLAIQSGLNNANHFFGSNNGYKIEYETIRSANTITGWSDSADGIVINFSKSYTNPIVVATKNTRNDSDGGWLRRRSIASDSISLTVDEDISSDSERSHTSEIAGILLFSQPFDVEFIYTGQASLVINEVMYKESTTGVNNNEFVELYVTASGNLKGTIISDQDTHYYKFPSFNVLVGDYVIYHTGTDPGGTPVIAGVHHFYQGVSNIWNNPDDDVLLIKPAKDVTTTTHGSASKKTFNGLPVDYMAYGRSSVGGNVDTIPSSMNGVTVSWDYSFGTELKGAAPKESISLTPNASDSNKAACWERTSSGNANNNGCSGYITTRATATSADKNSMGEDNTSSVQILLRKSSLTIYDPYNGASNPKAIPGSVIEYIVKASNDGNIAADNNTIKISDFIPTNTRLCVANIGSCKTPYFVDGTPSSGLSLAGTLYSNDNGTNYTYSVSADAEGADSSVTNLRSSMNGAFQPKTGAIAPNFSLKFRVIVE